MRDVFMATDKADKATFTSWKFDRLDEAMGDQSLTPAARVMAYWIMKHVNQHTQDAHVGLRCLMRESGFGVDTTTRAIDQLVAHGYFEKTPGKQGRGGRGNESRYRPLEKSSTIGPFGGEKESDDRTLSTDARVEKESDFTKERVRFCVEKSPTIGTEHLEHL
jgi:DNA-binding transcriptional MocR family regulator